MPKYSVQVIYDIKVQEIYEIVKAESAFTQKTGQEMLKVELKSKDNNDKRVYGVTLWPSVEGEQVSATSKFGCFYSVLGGDTGGWEHKWIYVSEWGLRVNSINLVAVPKMSLSQAAKRISEGEVK
jgi:hypothetical protein